MLRERCFFTYDVRPARGTSLAHLVTETLLPGRPAHARRLNPPGRQRPWTTPAEARRTAAWAPLTTRGPRGPPPAASPPSPGSSSCQTHAAQARKRTTSLRTSDARPPLGERPRERRGGLRVSMHALGVQGTPSPPRATEAGQLSSGAQQPPRDPDAPPPAPWPGGSEETARARKAALAQAHSSCPPGPRGGGADWFLLRKVAGACAERAPQPV